MSRIPTRGRVVVKINDEHVANAVPGSVNKCSAAHAIYSKFENAKHVSVGKQKIRITDGSTGIRWFVDTPIEVVEQVIVPLDEGRREETSLEKFTLDFDHAEYKLPTLRPRDPRSAKTRANGPKPKNRKTGLHPRSNASLRQS